MSSATATSGGSASRWRRRGGWRRRCRLPPGAVPRVQAAMKAAAVERLIPAQQWITIGLARSQANTKRISSSTCSAAGRMWPSSGSTMSLIPRKKVPVGRDGGGALDGRARVDQGDDVAGARRRDGFVEVVEGADMQGRHGGLSGEGRGETAPLRGTSCAGSRIAFHSASRRSSCPGKGRDVGRHTRPFFPGRVERQRNPNPGPSTRDGSRSGAAPRQGGRPAHAGARAFCKAATRAR
jgi:hypothetical protein